MVNDILRMHTVLESFSIQVGTSKNKINNILTLLEQRIFKAICKVRLNKVKEKSQKWLI